MSKETRDDKKVKKKKYRYIDTKCHRLIIIDVIRYMSYDKIWMIIIYFLKTLIKLLFLRFFIKFLLHINQYFLEYYLII